MSELAIPLIDCWKFMRFFLSIAEKLSILVGIHLYIIIHKGSFTFRCQCFSLTMSELSPKLSLSSAKHTRINYPNNKTTQIIHLRRVSPLPSYEPPHLSSGAPAASHATRDLLSTPGCVVVTSRYYRRQPLTLHRWWWWFMSGRFSPNTAFVDELNGHLSQQAFVQRLYTS